MTTSTSFSMLLIDWMKHKKQAELDAGEEKRLKHQQLINKRPTLRFDDATGLATEDSVAAADSSQQQDESDSQQHQQTQQQAAKTFDWVGAVARDLELPSKAKATGGGGGGGSASSSDVVVPISKLAKCAVESAPSPASAGPVTMKLSLSQPTEEEAAAAAAATAAAAVPPRTVEVAWHRFGLDAFALRNFLLALIALSGGVVFAPASGDNDNSSSSSTRPTASAKIVPKQWQSQVHSMSQQNGCTKAAKQRRQREAGSAATATATTTNEDVSVCPACTVEQCVALLKKSLAALEISRMKPLIVELINEEWMPSIFFKKSASACGDDDADDEQTSAKLQELVFAPLKAIVGTEFILVAESGASANDKSSSTMGAVADGGGDDTSNLDPPQVAAAAVAAAVVATKSVKEVSSKAVAAEQHQKQHQQQQPAAAKKVKKANTGSSSQQQGTTIRGGGHNNSGKTNNAAAAAAAAGVPTTFAFLQTRRPVGLNTQHLERQRRERDEERRRRDQEEAERFHNRNNNNNNSGFGGASSSFTGAGGRQFVSFSGGASNMMMSSSHDVMACKSPSPRKNLGMKLSHFEEALAARAGFGGDGAPLLNNNHGKSNNTSNTSGRGGSGNNHNTNNGDTSRQLLFGFETPVKGRGTQQQSLHPHHQSGTQAPPSSQVIPPSP